MSSRLLEQARNRLQAALPITGPGQRLDLTEVTDGVDGIIVGLWLGYTTSDEHPSRDAPRKSFKFRKECRELLLPIGFPDEVLLGFLDAWLDWLRESLARYRLTGFTPNLLVRVDALHRAARSGGRLDASAALRIKPADQLKALAALGIAPRTPAAPAALAKRTFSQVDDWTLYPYLRLMVALGENVNKTRGPTEAVSNDLWCVDLATINWTGSYGHIVDRMAALASTDVHDVESDFDIDQRTARLRFKCNGGACDLRPRVDRFWIDPAALASIAERLEAARPASDGARFAILNNSQLGQACLIAFLTPTARESLFSVTGFPFEWLTESSAVESATACGKRLEKQPYGNPGHGVWLVLEKVKGSGAEP